ncbi:MAG TPA: flagellar hook capping FlgD N-terminal domain-containing protein [Lacipirellula sp.]
MSQVSNVNSGSSQAFAGKDRLNDVDIDSFLKLMIAELQNRDPLNPLDNDELVAQIGQIRSVASTEKLTETLDSVLLGQNISSATNLIGAEIDAISDDNQKVSGIVERVSIANGVPKLFMDLNPKARESTEAGNIEAGEYEYRVVWRDEKSGTLLGVDPLQTADGKDGKLKLSEDGSSVFLSNLPETNAMRQVFRRKVGEDDFRLVASITEKKQSTFLDSSATDDLSNLVLDGAPQLMKSTRTFTVSLHNVGEIRPPSVRPPVATPTPAPSDNTGNDDNTTDGPTDNNETDDTTGE